MIPKAKKTHKRIKNKNNGTNDRSANYYLAV